MYQLVHSIHDRDMQERVLQAAAQVEGGEMSLTRTVKLCEAIEMVKESQEMMHGASGMLGLFCGVVSYETFLIGSSHFSKFFLNLQYYEM